MNLIIDAGNTLVKLAVLDKKIVLHHEKMVQSELHAGQFIEKIKEISNRFSHIDWAIVSNVGNLEENDFKALSKVVKVLELNHDSKIPFKNSYSTPKTLGVDRIALVTAAFYNNPKQNILVIDAGTCVTYDLLTEKGEYLGGAISPGLTMRYKALNQQTSKLPLLERDTVSDFLGNSTEKSIHSGVVNGILNEIDGVIAQYKTRFADLTVILTGGDAEFLSKRLKSSIFADSKFLMVGLNYLLDYNKG